MSIVAVNLALDYDEDDRRVGRKCKGWCAKLTQGRARVGESKRREPYCLQCALKATFTPITRRK